MTRLEFFERFDRALASYEGELFRDISTRDALDLAAICIAVVSEAYLTAPDYVDRHREREGAGRPGVGR